MSLLRQLFIGIAAATVLFLIASQALGIDTARRYLSQELRNRSESAATALATVYARDPSPSDAAWRAIAGAVFSDGAYSLVRVDGAIAFEFEKKPDQDAAPRWFAALAGMAPSAATQPFKTNAGTQGSITIMSDASTAVRALWRYSIALALLVALAGICWLVYARGLVRWLQKRLFHGISLQVRALANGEPAPAALPAWREIAEVADALAQAREQFRATAQEANARIESLEVELNLDAVTRLPNRKYFFNELRRALSAGGPHDGVDAGHVVIFRQRDLMAINRHMPRDFTDQWLRSVALRLDQKLGRRHVPAYLLGRLNGSDFALLLTGVQAGRAAALAERLRQELRALRVSLGGQNLCRWALAIAPFFPGQHASELLASLDHALMRAESADTDAVVQAAAQPSNERGGEHEWRNTLIMALEQHRFSLATGALRTDDGRELRHEATPMLHDADTPAPVEADVFMPAAVRLGLSAECDVQAVRLGLDWLISHSGQLALRIAVPSLAQPGFLARLSQMLHDRPAQAARLTLEIDARGLADHYTDVRALCEVASRAGTRIGVRALADDFKALTRLHEVPLAYVKLGQSFTAGIGTSPGSRRLAASVQQTAGSLGIDVYADGCVDAEGRAFLHKTGIIVVEHGGAGPLPG